MKFALLLILVTVIDINASVFSQSAALNLSVRDKSVKEILKLIEKQSNLRFFYNDEFNGLNKTTSLVARNKKAEEVLKQLFDKSEVTYKILDNNVVVITPANSSLVRLQQKKITGVITDGKTNETLPGVSVVVEGTTKGVVTDIDGKFSIEVPANATLLISYMGYAGQKVAVGSESQFTIKLASQSKELNETVVIGYAVVKKRDLTGSVGSVKSEEISKVPSGNAMEAIQGKVAGVDIVRSSGSAGSGAEIRVRGTRTFDQAGVGSNGPLYIIDGVQGASYQDINPADIESLDILKDASSTAIYGYQGAGGVVIITTKKAKAGKSKISYNGYYGINGLTSYPKGRLGEDYMNLRREAYKNAGKWSSTADDYKLFSSTKEWDAYQKGQWVDWVDEVLDNGSIQNHQLSVSGGNEKTRSYISGGYFREVDAVKADYTRYSGRINVDHTLNDWIKVNMLSQITYSNNNKVTDPLVKALTTSPLGMVYDANGAINAYPLTDGTTLSPITDRRANAHVDNLRTAKVFTTGGLELTPIKGLSVKSNLAINLLYSREGVFNDNASLATSSTQVNTASITTINSRNVNWDNIVNYNKTIGQHTLGLTALTSYTSYIYENVYASGTGQTLTSQSFYNLAGTTTKSNTSNYSEKATFSYAGRLNYGYKGKYLLTASYRLDGASCLASGNKWASFPSVAGAWRISEENFIKDRIPVVSNIKLRLGYGVAGNSTIEPYSTQSGLVTAASNISFGGTAASAYSFNEYMGNSNLTWERSATYNLGLDLGVFKDRLSLVIDMYNTKTTGVIYKRALPSSEGGTTSGTSYSTYQNAGSTRNRGIELGINSINIQSRDFKWTSSLTFYKNNEKIISLAEGHDLISASGAETKSLLIGRPIKSFYTYKKLGIWQIGEEAEMAKYNKGYTPGCIKVADINGDHVIDATNDRTYIGSATPKWESGLQNTITYKSFDLNVYLFARWGQTISYDILSRYNPAGTNNGPAFLNYWTPTNPTNDFPMPYYDRKLSDYAGYESLSYVDGSYFKIKNVTLGYTLPKKVANKVFDKFRVYVTAANLLTVTKSHLVKYYDPENGSSNTPMSKQLIFGVNAEF